MKIALYHNLGSGGSKREAFEFAKQFAALGHAVDLFCPSTADEDFLPMTGFVRESRCYPLELAGEVKFRLPGLRRYADLAILLRNIARIDCAAKEIAADIDAGGYDFAFLHHDRLVQSPRVLKYLRTRAVYYCAEPMREFYEPAVPRPYENAVSAADRFQRAWYLPARAARRHILKARDRENIGYPALLMTNSEFSAENILNAYGKRAEVCYLGVDASVFRPLGLKREAFVISVGAVAPLKGYDFLIESLGAIKDSERPPLVIVGNTASRAEADFLKCLAAEKKVRIDFRVNVTEEELVRLYNQARAFLYAPVREPFGLAPLEAMACGTPVAGVREGGVCESVQEGETGILSPRKAASMAENIRKILFDQTLRDRLAANGLRRINEFWNWPKAAERFMNIVERGSVS